MGPKPFGEAGGSVRTTPVDAFYRALDEHRFESTEHTIGPWSPDSQHAGPPSALIGRAIERVGENPHFHVARITLEILRPVPIEPLTVTAEVVRPGRSVELVEASLATDTHEVMKARAWRIRESGPHDLEAVLSDRNVPGTPEQGIDAPKPDHGYLKAMDTRFIEGSFAAKGPAIAWFRMRHPLVDDEEASPLTRVLIAADSGNGISAALDWGKWWFINPDLSVYLQRLPSGEWVCLDAVSTPGENGVGIAISTISDLDGAIGHGIQSLFIGPMTN